ncbi:MAG: hypothetical protein WC123_07485 [Bacilli bacterium]|jgi:hypothetical protein
MPTNNQTSPTRHINGVKAYKVAGSWYCDYNQYQQTRQQQGIKPSEEVFISFCNRYDLLPTG